MECSICLYQYDTGLHIPMAIPCGHTLCNSCLESFYLKNTPYCPFDHKDFPEKLSLRPNYDLLEFVMGDQNILKCPNSHRITEKVTASSACDFCGKNETVLWYCLTCQFGVCDSCKEWFENSDAIQVSGIKCFKGHELRLSENIGAIYKRKGKYLCDGCGQLKVKTSAHCRKCRVDYCLDCYEMINAIINSEVHYQCKCGGKTAWRFDQVAKKCGKCKQKYEKSGSTSCARCGTRYCISCSFFFIQISKINN